MKRTMRMFPAVAVITAGLTLAACGSLSGTYETSNGVASVSFKSGKAYVTMLGNTEVCEYETKGDKIMVHVKGRGTPDVVFTRNDDGTIDGPLGNMKRRKS